MDFPTALSKCLAGAKITNNNWNGKGMYVFAMPGYPDGVPANKALSDCSGIELGSSATIDPYLMMRNARGTFVSWLISNMDVFSTEWEVLK